MPRILCGADGQELDFVFERCHREHEDVLAAVG